MGLLYFFVSLWILSIFGNYNDPGFGNGSPLAELLVFSLLFGAAAITCIITGIKTDDKTMRSFGLTFLFINLYTKYFEYFWNVAHKALFFAVLGLSFYLLGRYSEKALAKAYSVLSMPQQKPENDLR
ncbi:MAG: hypothetical protein ACOC2H_04765 [Spirochaetota bacterium]